LTYDETLKPNQLTSFITTFGILSDTTPTGTVTRRRVYRSSTSFNTNTDITGISLKYFT